MTADARIVFISREKGFRGMLLSGTALVNTISQAHELGILETLVLGQASIAAGLMTMSLKGQDRLQLEIGCSGPIRGLTVEARADGDIRGYLHQVPIPVESEPESFDLSPFFGAGLLTVKKIQEAAKQPFSSTVHLAHGNIGQDVAYYYLSSEQTHTVVHVSVFFDKKGTVSGAGGLFLQRMPGCLEDEIATVEQLLPKMPGIGKSLAEGMTAGEWISFSLGALSPEILDTLPVQFKCSCTKERIAGFLISMEQNNTEQAIENGPYPLVTRCHYCNRSYSFTKEDLRFFSQ